MNLDDEVTEWVGLLSNWPESEKEAHKRLLTRSGLPDIKVPVGKETQIQKPLRSILWKYFLLHSSSAFSNFYPPSVTNDKTRKEYYSNLLNKKPNKNHLHAIEKDLNRSAPAGDYATYLDSTSIKKLRRILTAYSIYDSELGYCQGLNFIAFMLLIHLEEVDAFWGLLLLLNGFNVRSLFMVNSNMLQEFLNMLDHELKTRFPQLHRHMNNEGINVTMYAMEWLTTFFVYNFPLSTTERVWDIMLARGFEGGSGSLAWIYQISMAIYQICHVQILEWGIDEIMTSIRTLTTEIHPHILLKRAIDFYPTDNLQRKLESLASQGTPYPSCVIS